MPRRHARVPLAIRLYQAAVYRKGKLLGQANAVFDGFWLGLLSREDWAHFDQIFYDTRQELVGERGFRYDQEEWNLSGLHGWEAAAIASHFPAGSRVVVTGAGGGREVLGLLEREFDAVGYEPHPGLVEAGLTLLARRGYPGRLRLSDRDRFPVIGGGCEAVLVGWGSYSLIAGRQRRIDFLRAARASLPEGAPILISFFPRIGQAAVHLTTVRRVANVVRRARRSEPVELGDALSPNLVHWFTREEIGSELEAAGFRLELFERHPYGHAVGRSVPVEHPAGSQASER